MGVLNGSLQFFIASEQFNLPYPSISQTPSALENNPVHQHPELDPHEIQPSEKH